MEANKKQGVLLVNLGTPDAPTPSAVKQFLTPFLSDQRVVDTSPWLWQPLLRAVILPIRSPKVAKLYQSVWMEEGSPLMVYSRRQAQRLAAKVGVPVELAMTYGNPSLESGVTALTSQGCEELIVLPLYPQYSATTTAAVVDGLAQVLAVMPTIPGYSIVRDYHDHPSYIEALASSVRRHWAEHGRSDYLLCSYHGIPKRYADNGDIYPTHCEKTTTLLAKALELEPEQIGQAYQSRFGREEWLKPYTDETLQQLPKLGRKRIDVIAPAFASDCLETLEEMAEQNKEVFLEAGGEQYRYIACLNDDEQHIDMMVELVRRYLP